MNKRMLLIISIIFSSLLLIASILSFWIEPLTSIKIIFGSIFIFFLPGFFLSLVLLPKKEAGKLERLFLSFAFSFCIIPLFTFYMSLIGLKITFALNLIVSLAIIFSCLGYLAAKKPKAIKQSPPSPINDNEQITSPTQSPVYPVNKRVNSKKRNYNLVYVLASVLFVLAMGTIFYKYFSQKTEFAVTNPAVEQSGQNKNSSFKKGPRTKIKISYSKEKIKRLESVKSQLDEATYQVSETESDTKNGEMIKYISSKEEIAKNLSNDLSISNIIKDDSLGSDIVIFVEKVNIRDKSSLNIKVENGTTIDGLAAKSKDSLIATGYTTISIGNALDQNSLTTKIYYSPGLKNEADRLLNDLGNNNIELIEGETNELDMILTLGIDSQLEEDNLPE